MIGFIVEGKRANVRAICGIEHVRRQLYQSVRASFVAVKGVAIGFAQGHLRAPEGIFIGE